MEAVKRLYFVLGVKTRNFFAKNDGKEALQRKSSERCWREGNHSLGRDTHKGFTVGLAGLSSKERCQKEHSKGMMSGRASL